MGLDLEDGLGLEEGLVEGEEVLVLLAFGGWDDFARGVSSSSDEAPVEKTASLGLASATRGEVN